MRKYEARVQQVFVFYVLRLLFEINPPGWSPYQFFSIDRSVRENERAGRAKTRPASFVPEHGPVLGKEQKSVPELGALFLVPTLRVQVLGQKSENTRLREKARRRTGYGVWGLESGKNGDPV